MFLNADEQKQLNLSAKYLTSYVSDDKRYYPILSCNVAYGNEGATFCRYIQFGSLLGFISQKLLSYDAEGTANYVRIDYDQDTFVYSNTWSFSSDPQKLIVKFSKEIDGKQLDFLLLGVDHFVNTLNAIKTNYKKLKGSYTIITFACDQGFQGPQSSFNNIDDLSSLAQFDTYQINTLYEAKKIIPYAINKRGFKIISIGQRLSGQEIYSENPTHISKNYSFLIFQ